MYRGAGPEPSRTRPPGIPARLCRLREPRRGTAMRRDHAAICIRKHTSLHLSSEREGGRYATTGWYSRDHACDDQVPCLALAPRAALAVIGHRTGRAVYAGCAREHRREEARRVPCSTLQERAPCSALFRSTTRHPEPRKGSFVAHFDQVGSIPAPGTRFARRRRRWIKRGFSVF